MLKTAFNYIVAHIDKITISYLVAIIIAFIILPYLDHISFIDKLHLLQTNNPFWLVSILAAFAIIFIVNLERFRSFATRYFNTCKLGTWVDLSYVALIIFFTLLFCVLYVWTNKISFPWSFERISSLIAFIIIVSFFVAAQFIKRKEKPPKAPTANPNIKTFPISDEPIRKSSDDLLNRKKFVSNWIKEIKQLATDESYVYGLNAHWGEGKSSIINMLIEEFSSTGKYYIVTYDPWYYTDEMQMVSQFYGEIAKQISKEYIFDGFFNLVKKYSRLISFALSKVSIPWFFNGDKPIRDVKQEIEDFISNTGKKVIIIIDDIDRLNSDEILLIFKLVKNNTNLRNTIFILSYDLGIVEKKLKGPTFNSSLEYIKKIVQNQISVPKIEQNMLGKYFFWSDHEIPEYSVEQILEETVNNNISTWGSIAAFNEKGVLLKDNNGETKIQIEVPEPEKAKEFYKIEDFIFIRGDYNDKVIQIKNNDAERYILKYYRLSLIDEFFHYLSIDNKELLPRVKEFDEKIRSFYNDHLSKILTNVREVKRYINHLYSSLPPIIDDIYLYDFFLLEMLKIYAKDVYDDIYENWKYYVQATSEREHGDIEFSWTDRPEKAKKIVEHTEKILNSIEDDTKKEVIKEILHELFPIVKNNGNNHGIQPEDEAKNRIFTKKFSNYFYLSVPQTDLSKQDIETAIKVICESTDNDSINNLFGQFKIIGKLKNLLEYLIFSYRDRISSNKACAYKLIRFLYSSTNNDLFSKKDDFLLRSEISQVNILILAIIDDLIRNNTVPKSEAEMLIKEVLERAANVEFARRFIYSLVRQKGDAYKVYEIVNTETVRNIMTNRVKKHYSDENNNILEEYPEEAVWILASWINNWDEETQRYKKDVNEYVAKLIQSSNGNLVRLVTLLSSSYRNHFNDGVNFADLEKNFDLENIVSRISNLDKTQFSHDEIKLLDLFYEAYKQYKEKQKSDKN